MNQQQLLFSVDAAPLRVEPHALHGVPDGSLGAGEECGSVAPPFAITVLDGNALFPAARKGLILFTAGGQQRRTEGRSTVADQTPHAVVEGVRGWKDHVAGILDAANQGHSVASDALELEELDAAFLFISDRLRPPPTYALDARLVCGGG